MHCECADFASSEQQQQPGSMQACCSSRCKWLLLASQHFATLIDVLSKQTAANASVSLIEHRCQRGNINSANQQQMPCTMPADSGQFAMSNNDAPLSAAACRNGAAERATMHNDGAAARFSRCL